MSEFVLHLKDIDEGGKAYRFALPSTFMMTAVNGTDVRPDASVPEGVVEIFAQRTGKDILVTGRIRTRIVTECSRCLEDAPIDVDSPVSSLFTARGAALRPEPDEEELTPEELAREFFTGDTLVLDALVREQILLEVPMQPLCKESCPGIPVPDHVRPPADFGKEPDPRLAPLSGIAAQMSGKRSNRSSNKD